MPTCVTDFETFYSLSTLIKIPQTMKVEDINLDQFKTIEEHYSFVDENVFDFEKSGDLANLWIRYRDYVQNDVEREKAQFEIDYLLHYPLDGRFFPLVSGKTGKAEKSCTYPDLSEAAKEEFDHLLVRAEYSKHPYLKAKFFHILWQCPSGLRNRKYAESAAANYIDSIELLQNEIIQNKNMTLLSLMQQGFENLSALCKEVKLKDIDLNSLLKKLLKEHANFPFCVKEQLATVVLKYPSLFNSESITLCYGVYEYNFYEVNNRKDPFLIIHHYAPNAIRFAQKLKTNQKKWYGLIGELQLEHVKSENDPSRSWLNLNELLAARKNLKNSGNSKLLNEAEILYEKIRPEVEIQFRSHSLTRKNHEELFSYRDSRIQLANTIAKEFGADLIFKRLSAGTDFPKAAGFDLKESNLVPDFFRGIQTVFIDRNGNVENGNDELDEKVMLFNFYQLELDFQTIPFLHTLFTRGIQSGKLTARNLISYLAHNTWIGNPYFVQQQKKRDHIKSWVSLLAPAIIEFFAQVQASQSSQTYQPSYVLCVDSMALKIEGLIRFFLYQSGIKTTVAKSQKIELITLNQLLNSDGFKQFFNKDDQLFFSYLFGGEGGLDIRNNVAHCFYDDDNYSSLAMILIICALLRIGKYNFKWVKLNEEGKENLL